MAYTIKLKGKECRYVNLQGLRHYYVSDIIKHFGRGFLSFVEDKNIIMMKLRDNNVNATRRLIRASLIDHNKLVTLESKRKAITKAKNKAVQVKHKTREAVGFTKPEQAARFLRDADTARDEMLRKEIHNLCMNKSVDDINARNLTNSDIKNSDRWVYRESYRTLYHEFDRIIGNRLKRIGATLSDYGLGYAFKKNASRYIDNIAKVGLLPELYTMAKALFGK